MLASKKTNAVQYRKKHCCTPIFSNKKKWLSEKNAIDDGKQKKWENEIGGRWRAESEEQSEKQDSEFEVQSSKEMGKFR